MLTSADQFAVDTSVAVAALDATHVRHQTCRDAVRTNRPALAGHATFETLSVVTRMPGRLAVDAPTAVALIERAFPNRVWIEPSQADELFGRCGEIGIVGGAVYDALVGWASATNQRVLLTRDLRARRTYDLLGVDYQLVD